MNNQKNQQSRSNQSNPKNKAGESRRQLEDMEKNRLSSNPYQEEAPIVGY